MRFVAFTVLAFLACATPPQPAPSAAPSGPPALVLPPMVVAMRGTELLTPEEPNYKVATPRSGLPLTVRGTEGTDVRVALEGAIDVAGAVPLQRLGVEVCEPGPLGERFYAGNSNTLWLRSGVVDGRVRVAGIVEVRALEHAEGVPFSKQFRRIEFEEDVEVSRLCAAPQPKRHAGTDEDPQIAYLWGEADPEDFPKGTAIIQIEKDVSLALLDAPDGAPVHTFPASKWGFKLMRLRNEGAWDLVAAGGGPYLVGWIPARAPWVEKKGAVGGLLGSFNAQGPMSLHLKELEQLPLHALPAGVEVHQVGVVRARLNKDGSCRVERADGDWSLVTAAVDDDVTVRGWVQTSAIGPKAE